MKKSLISSSCHVRLCSKFQDFSYHIFTSNRKDVLILACTQHTYLVLKLSKYYQSSCIQAKSVEKST
jgi:hypothetical protein